MDKRTVYGQLSSPKRMKVMALIEDSVACVCIRDEPCEHSLGYCRQYDIADLAKVETVIAEKDEALSAVLSECGIVFDDERLNYIKVQMPRGVLKEVRDALAKKVI